MTIRATDREASVRFYETVLAVLGVEKAAEMEEFVEFGDFSLAAATDEKPVTRNLHIAFTAPSQAVVDEFWRVGTAAGYPDDGAAGLRPHYGPDYYGGFLLDPDGNSVEAVHHDLAAERGLMDHLWIRVADVQAAKRFYAAVAPFAGLELGDDTPERVQFRGDDGSFSLVAGTPTEHVHLAFPAPDLATVNAFHQALLAAGYPDEGAPGERPQYHPGYYGAFVLDPDGNNVELVFHDRR